MPRTRLLPSGVVVAAIVMACGGPPNVRVPRAELPLSRAEGVAAWTRAMGVFESRCVVCHGCYDAPCQLKLGSHEGIERGGTEAKVYDGSRLRAAAPTRLGVDAQGPLEWRERGFHPVLPEGEQRESRASLLVRMLELKRSHPLASTVDVAKEFTLDLDRKQVCTDAAHFDGYAKEHPLWGMPYALPALSPEDEAAIVTWVRAGAPHGEPAPVSAETTASIASWESFLNQGSTKGQLVGRYVYEHLFVASIRFEDGTGHPALYRLVRSKTETGRPVVEIATRTPFEDPGVARVHYRFVRRTEAPLEKTHMPYRLDAARLARWKKLFIEPAYDIARLPGYDPQTAANPFRAFEALPATARYRFLLEEAEFTVMGFIKGPVCRGQVALNVIEDRFWVAFVDPEVPWQQSEAAFLSAQKEDLDMPAEGGANPLPTIWFRYGAAHARYTAMKAARLDRVTKEGQGITPEMIWDGDGTNANAALTVFRHFDSATVVKGFVGLPPKTGWLLDYPLLERIHYLLVAGFDVFGNVGHHLTTRLYMDYLRMGAEAGFLALLPLPRRAELADHWYRGVDGDAKIRIRNELVGRTERVGIKYATKTPELEAFDVIRRRVGPALSTRYDLSQITDPHTRAAFERLRGVRGRAASVMPETSFVTVEDDSASAPSRRFADFTLLRDSAHANVAHLFQEAERRLYGEDELSAVPGFLGAYPNELFLVKRSELDAFADAVTALDGPASLRMLRERYGVLRSNPGFWAHSDRMNRDHVSAAPLENGLFDYSRLDP